MVYELNWLFTLYKLLETLGYVSFCFTKNDMYETAEMVRGRKGEREKFAELRKGEETKERTILTKSALTQDKIETSSVINYVLLCFTIHCKIVKE